MLPTLATMASRWARTCGSSSAPRTAAGAVSITTSGRSAGAVAATACRRVMLAGIASPGKAKPASPAPACDALGQVLEAEEAVADARRRVAVVKDGHGQHVGRVEVHAKGAKGAGQGLIVEIEHRAGGERSPVTTASSSLTICTPMAGDLLQVVVEGAGGVGRGKDAVAGFQVILGGPAARPAAHGHAGQQQVLAGLRRRADGLGQQRRRRGHDQLERILRFLLGVEQQHVLRAGADVYSQNLHKPLSPRYWIGTSDLTGPGYTFIDETVCSA